MTTKLEKIEAHIAAMTEWLKENHPEVSDEQKHLDAGTPERAYWHYGYIMASRDMLKLIMSDDNVASIQ